MANGDNLAVNWGIHCWSLSARHALSEFLDMGKLETLTRKFEVVGLNIKHAVSDPKRLEVNVRIKFVRRIRSANLALRVHSCTGMQQAPHIHPIKVETLSNVMKDEQRTIKFATLIIPYPGYTRFHSIWGNTPLSTDATAPSLVSGSENVVYLELTGPRMMGQRHKFFVVNLDYAAPQAMPAIYAQDEDDDVFEIAAVGSLYSRFDEPSNLLSVSRNK